MKNVLITGASGGLGFHVLDLIKDTSLNPITLSRKRPVNLPKRGRWVRCDLTCRNELEKNLRLFQDVNEVWHLGAFVPKRDTDIDMNAMFATNVRSLEYLVNFALIQQARFVFLSGAIVYKRSFGKKLTELDETSVNCAGDFYGSTKYLGETLLRSFEDRGLNLTVLRPSSIYGFKVSEGGLVSRMLNLASKDRTIPVYPPFDESFNLVHGFDVGRAILSCSKLAISGTFNVSGFNYTVPEIAKACIEVAGRGSLELHHQPKKPGFQSRVTSTYDLCGNLASDKLGFQPQYNLKKGLLEFDRMMQR